MWTITHLVEEVAAAVRNLSAALESESVARSPMCSQTFRCRSPKSRGNTWFDRKLTRGRWIYNEVARTQLVHSMLAIFFQLTLVPNQMTSVFKWLNWSRLDAHHALVNGLAIGCTLSQTWTTQLKRLIRCTANSWPPCMAAISNNQWLKDLQWRSVLRLRRNMKEMTDH